MLERTATRETTVRAAIVVALIADALFVPPAMLSGDWITTLTSVAIYSIVAGGLVVLYGKVGMISLGQVGLLAIGTWTATRLFYWVNLPYPLLMLATGAITCVVGVLIGLPALRLSGVHLALITLMGAGAIDVILHTIDFPNGGGGFSGHQGIIDPESLKSVQRPSWGTGDTAFYRYAVIVTALLFLLAPILGVGEAFHVDGTVEGEGETHTGPR